MSMLQKSSISMLVSRQTKSNFTKERFGAALIRILLFLAKVSFSQNLQGLFFHPEEELDLGTAFCNVKTFTTLDIIRITSSAPVGSLSGR